MDIMIFLFHNLSSFFIFLSLIYLLLFSLRKYLHFEIISKFTRPQIFSSTAQCTGPLLLDKLFVHLYIQSTKILLVPPKCQIMVLCQIDNFFNMAIAILDFSLLLPYSYCFSNFAIVKVVALCFILCRAFID